MEKIFLLIFALAVWQQVALATLPPINELALNVPQTYISTPENKNWTYFQFKMPKVIPDEDLAVIVRPGDFKSDPDVFISENEQYPSHQSNDEACFQYGYDVCYIGKQQLAENKTFYIGVNCPQGKCKFHVVVTYTVENLITFNQTFEYHYKEKGEEIFKFYVPPDPSMEHISVSLEINRGFLIDEDVKMYVAQGNDPASTSNSLPVFVTEYGQIFTAFRENNFFCTGCNYTLFVEAPKGALVMITAKSSNRVHEIHMGRKYFDALYRGMSFTYLLNTSQENINRTQSGSLDESLYFSLIASHGDPDLYVTCGKGPFTSLSYYLWKIEGKGAETLFVSREEFQKEFSGKSCEIITITVIARTGAAFGLLVNRVGQDLMGIRPGEVETGYVLINEHVNYVLTLNNKEPLDLTVSVLASNGNPDLLIRGCGSTLDFTSCIITEEMIKNRAEIKQKKEFFFDYSFLMGNDAISFRHDPDTCRGTISQSNTSFCSYLITVFANKTYTNIDRTEFKLLASIEKKPTFLKEQTPVKGSLDVEEYNYYRFTLLDAKDVLSVNFQVTILSGRPDLFSSRTEQMPGFGKYEKAACFCQNLISYSSSEASDLPLNSTYYVSVYGMTMSAYTINVLIERKGNGEPHIIKLYDSLPQKFVMPLTQEYAYFEFSVPLVREPIDIMLTPLKGNFKFYVNEQASASGLPTEKSHKWTSHYQSHLLIRPEQVTSTFFTVGVKPTYLEPNADNYQFSILYSSSNKVVSLQPGQPFSAMVSKNDTVFFQFSVAKNVSEVVLSQASARDLVHMMLSTNNEDPFPEKSNMSTFNTTSHFITLNEAVLKEECDNLEEKGVCFFYGALRSESEKQAHVSLLLDLKMKSSDEVNYIWINDGTFMNLPLPATGEVKRFVAQLPSFNVTVVDVATLDGQIDIMANVINTAEKKLSSDWEFPNKASSSPAAFFSKHSYFNTKSIKFSEANFTKCRPNCLVALLLVVHNNTGIKYGKEPSFTIQVTSQVLTIEEDQNLIGEVHPDTINYYRYYNRHPNATLYITVTPITPGDPDLVVKLGENERPTLSDYTWVSRKLASDQIEISWANSKEKFPSGTMVGSFMIGVVGGSRKKLTYQLSCSSGEVKMLELQDSFPTDVTVGETKWIYLSYKKKSQGIKKISLVVLRLYGKGEFFVKKYLLSENPSLNLPTENNRDLSQKTNEHANGDSVVIAKGSDAFCDVCKYVFAFRADKDTKFSASIIVPDVVTYLKPGYSLMNTVAWDEVKVYNFMLTPETDVEISMSILSGSPSIKAELLPGNDLNPATFTSRRIRNSSMILMNIPCSKYRNKTTLQIEVKGDSRFEALMEKDMSFVITVQNFNTLINLKPGIFLHGAVNSQTQMRLYYFSNERSAAVYGGKVSITVIYDNYPNLTFKDLHGIFNISFFQKFNENSDSLFPLYSSVQEARGKTIFSLPVKENTTILINIQKTGKTSAGVSDELLYTLVLDKGLQAPTNLIYLPDNQEYTQTIEKGSRSLFEYKVDQRGFIFFQLRDCAGEFQLNGTDKLEGLLSGNYNIRVQNPIQANIFGIASVNPGKFYFSIKAFNGTEFQDSFFSERAEPLSSRAFYHLKVNFYKEKGDILYLSVEPGNHGKIVYNINERDDKAYLTLRYSNLESDGRVDLHAVNSFSVFYIISNSTRSLKSMQKCWNHLLYQEKEVIVYTDVVRPELHTIEFNLEYDLLKREFPGNSYLLITLSIQFNYEYKRADQPDYLYETLDIPYETIEVPMNVEFKRSSSSKWIVILVFSLVILCLFGLFLLRRYKRLKQKLIYELTEARAQREYSGTSMEI